jgi:hypothetical protein
MKDEALKPDQTVGEVTSMTAENNRGGGTGGGLGPADRSESVDGVYTIAANQFTVLARPPIPPAIPGPSHIDLVATGLGVDGQVTVRGSQGVRVTAGPPPALPTGSSTTNGVEIIVGEAGNLTLQRGLLPEIDQKMELTPGAVTIDGGAGTVTIKSLTKIELSVCEGVAKITIDPTGVTIDALMIKLSAQVMAQIQGVMAQLSGDAMTQISGGITMIG